MTATPPSSARHLISLATQPSLMVMLFLPDEDGASDSQVFQSAIEVNPHSIILYAFDLMLVDGTDLRRKSLAVRRSIFKALIGTDEESSIQFSEEFGGEGAVLLKACAEHGLEGIVSKQAFAPYRSGRSNTWLRCKCFTESRFVVFGTDRDRKTGALGLCSPTLTAKA